MKPWVSQKPCAFTGFLPPGKTWGLKNHVFSQVVCLLGKTARGRKTGTCGGSKHICFHSRPGRRPSAREAALQVRSQNIRPCGWGWFQTCSLSLQFYFSRSLAFSFYPSQSVCVCVSLSLSFAFCLSTTYTSMVRDSESGKIKKVSWFDG